MSSTESVASASSCPGYGYDYDRHGIGRCDGIKAIHQEGGLTVGQDQMSCAVYGMPRVCAEMGTLDRTVPLSQISHEILRAARYRKTGVG